MNILLQNTKIARSTRILSIEETRNEYQKYRKISKRYFYLYLIFLCFSPFASIFILVLLFIKTYNFLNKFFSNENYIRQYEALLQPQTAKEVVSIIGYRVYDEELDGHLSLIKSQNLKTLIKKQQIMSMKNNSFRWVGLDSKLAKTHIALIGKTGAGKTECIRSICDDVMLNGGGVFFNDGKSDVKMLDEFLSQAKRNGRETSVQVLNFLKAEKTAQSNTFNFFLNQHPAKLLGFLSSLAFSGGGDGGNLAYFQNRAKTLLLPVLMFLSIRKKMLNEIMNSEIIKESMQLINLISIYICLYSMCRDIEYYIKNCNSLSAILNDDSIIVQETLYFNSIEKILSAVIQEPNKKKIIEENLNINISFIRECYIQSYKVLSSYLEAIWGNFKPYLESIAFVCYVNMKEKNNEKRFFNKKENNLENTFSLQDIKIFYNSLKAEPNKMLNNDNMLEGFLSDKDSLELIKRNLADAFKQDKENVEKPPQDAIQQHSYGQQQWEMLFNTFTSFSHIFAPANTEIDPVEAIRDNKILYILLPVLELSKDEVQILGKIIIMTIKGFAGKSLGGEFITIHKTIKNIAKDKMTPKPFSFIILDEYGAYPVGEIDTILAQVRSLNMSVALGIQDFVSLKTSGSDDTAQKRALANTSKIIFKVADRDVIEWLDSMIAEEEFEKNEYKKDAAGDIITDTAVSFIKEKKIKFKKVQEADNGFCLMLLGSENDRAIWLHTFFRGGTSDNTKLINLKPINNFRIEFN
ncbi:type IV secretion system DNA-binding domain-containing protein [Campylobacter canadensis]|uniref:type IV secretion system DNA-binding domain-containing protein n=1 Tax=Campylobacter canadensis TaxID=449520 RepID=UPI001CCF4CC9|nr:type IV secretion system DNA-binding domain-containing protein [Campylobacter canadensis]MBZ8002394.1 type IV secretion system DNA-binding domain-containing protein [Campylobacter canadensis]